MIDLFWIAAITGSWLAAMVVVACCFDVRDWWERRQDEKRILARLRALGAWRRARGMDYRRKERYD